MLVAQPGSATVPCSFLHALVALPQRWQQVQLEGRAQQLLNVPHSLLCLLAFLQSPFFISIFASFGSNPGFSGFQQNCCSSVESMLFSTIPAGSFVQARSNQYFRNTSASLDTVIEYFKDHGINCI